MTKERQRLGAEGEELAKRFLRSKNYRIVESNFKAPFGEIDLIAYQRKVLVFIEVKARTSYNFGMPEESISQEKKKKISKVASLYLKAKGLNNVDCRFDVVCITLGRESRSRISPTHLHPHLFPPPSRGRIEVRGRRNSYTIKLIKDAFQLC